MAYPRRYLFRVLSRYMIAALEVALHYAGLSVPAHAAPQAWPAKPQAHCRAEHGKDFRREVFH